MGSYDAFVDQLRTRLWQEPAAERLDALRRELRSTSAPVLGVDDQGGYVAFSPAALALTGYSDTELLQMRVIDLTPLASAEDGIELWESFMRVGRQRGEYEVRRKFGAPLSIRYWAYASVIPGVHLSFLEHRSDRAASTRVVA